MLVILLTVLLDAVGIGLIMPILPALLRSLGGLDAGSLHYGALLAAYALMQFLFSPILGALSDRFGRRPVLLISLAGAAADYLLMAFAPTLAWLYLGRLLAGITGANMAVATAYVTDITPAGQRARRFGLVGAVFGVGFIVGPLLGGSLGEWHLHAPFLAAAAMNAVNLAMAFFLLPESRKPRARAAEKIRLNPFSSLRRLHGKPGLLPLAGIYLIMALVSQAPATLWILYGQDRFGWSMMVAGLSLAGYGACHARLGTFRLAAVLRGGRYGAARAAGVNGAKGGRRSSGRAARGAGQHGQPDRRRGATGGDGAVRCHARCLAGPGLGVGRRPLSVGSAVAGAFARA